MTDVDVLQTLLDNKQYPELEHRLEQGTRSPEDEAFFRGIVANRKNQVQQSLHLLEPLAQKAATGRPSLREKEILSTLADDYTKTFAYAKAETAFATLLRRHGKSLSRKQRQDVRDRLSEMHLLRNSPPQEVQTSAGPFSLAAHRNGLGLVEVPVEVDGKIESWVLDTGANTCVITETAARRIGLRLLKGTATTRGLSGLSVSFQIGLASRLKIGTTVLHNVELPVTSDTNLNFAGVQIQGIIGFPVQAALGGITFYSDDRVGSKTESGDSPGSELFLQNQTPLVVVRTEGSNLLFSLDTGATGSTFSRRFYDIIKGRLEKHKSSQLSIDGAGGKVSFPGYYLNDLQLSVGGQDTTLNQASVFAAATHTDVDEFFGNLGQDVLASFKSYSIDFTEMKFTARK
jgi:predicted aspartyl protease